MEYQSLIQVLKFKSLFPSDKQRWEQGKKFTGYENNLYEGKQDAIKQQMFSKVEATGKLNSKSIYCKKNHQYLIWKFLEHEKCSLGVH